MRFLALRICVPKMGLVTWNVHCVSSPEEHRDIVRNTRILLRRAPDRHKTAPPFLAIMLALHCESYPDVLACAYCWLVVKR